MTLELFVAAAARPNGMARSGLEPGLLRFSLQYPAAINLEAERARLATLLGGDGFVLKPMPGNADATFAILEFPGLQRQQSASFLFDQAGQLADALGLVSATPDVDPGWINGDELGRDMPESIGGAVGLLCESHAEPPTDPHWSVQAVHADIAWVRFKTRGEGIRIGQPDTGVADHREIDSGIEAALGTDIMAGGGPPIDPLQASGGNPGHGTATSSCAISRESGGVIGSAPRATLVPVRCVNSVVIGSGAAVAVAIDHARQKGCHIVTMSLGGPIEFPDLRAAIKRAVDADMIVMAAAGNCVKVVVYPAWDQDVLSVAGIDQHRQRWKGSSHGASVDIAAPAEHVFVARRSTPNDADRTKIHPGQGTSFAVAITAGCAALWLSHHGVDAVKAAAAARGCNVQELFRSAVRATAERPPAWPDGMGTGIVNAEALLALSLDDVVIEPLRKTGHPAWPELGDLFDWQRHGAEAGFLSLDRIQRGDPARAPALESPVAPSPSEGLRAAMKAVGKSSDEVFGAPTIVGSPLTPEMSSALALRIIAGNRPGPGGTVESSGGLSEAAARGFLKGEGKQALVDHIEATLGNLRAEDDADPRIGEFRKSLIASMPETLNNLAAGARPRDLSTEARFGLEALVRMTGRPSLRIKDGEIDPQDPQLGDWAQDLLVGRARLKPLIDAVGRIDIAGEDGQIHIGTGTVVADGVVMTNRHVLDAVAEPLPGPTGSQRFILTGSVSIVFNEAASGDVQRFELTEVLAAGPDRIGQHADIAKLDMAFFQMKKSNAAGTLPPAPVPVGAMPDEGGPSKILVIGFPAAPTSSSVRDPETGLVSIDIVDRLGEIYQDAYGVKYASPGVVELGIGALPDDPRGWGFSHDATTLAGNSGSSVVGLESKRVCGLHFGGAPLRQNLAHGLAAVRTAALASGVIDEHVIERLLWPQAHG
jgi:serine protease